MENDNQTEAALSLLAEIVENDDVSIFLSAIEGEPWTADFEDWAKRARELLRESREQQVGEVSTIDADLTLPSGKYHMREDGSAWLEDGESNVTEIVRTKE